MKYKYEAVADSLTWNNAHPEWVLFEIEAENDKEARILAQNFVGPFYEINLKSVEEES